MCVCISYLTFKSISNISQFGNDSFLKTGSQNVFLGDWHSAVAVEEMEELELFLLFIKQHQFSSTKMLKLMYFPKCFLIISRKFYNDLILKIRSQNMLFFREFILETR